MIDRKKITVKVVKATWKSYWYAKSIGSIYTVYDNERADYALEPKDGKHLFIKKDDCIVLAELDNEWKPLKVDNLPPDILTGDYEFQYYDDLMPIKPWVDADEPIETTLCDLLAEVEYRYRLRKPTVEELAERYVKDYAFNYDIATRDRIEYAYIAGYNEAEK